MRFMYVLSLVLLPLFIVVYATDPIIWPMQPQDNTHTLWHSYGDFCTAIWEVTQEFGVNFHSGVDLTDPTPDQEDDPAEDVFCVRSGYVTDVGWKEGVTPDPPMAHDDYGIVICDIYQQPTGFGWSYQHIEDHTYTGGGQNNNPWSTDEIFPGNHFDERARIGDIDNDFSSQSGPGWTGDHLHFMRSAAIYDPSDPGFCNPLYYLIPEPSQNPPDFTWSFSCDPTLPYAFFALPDYDAAGEPGWINQWADSLECIAEIDEFQDNIHGRVDLIAWFYVEGVGQTGSYPKRKCMPQRLEWWLERWDPVSSTWYEVQDRTGTTYRRYPFDFGDIELGDASHWEKYRQLYFRWWLNVTNTAYYCCLTNCSDAEDWNGIGNIEENYWQTDIQDDLSGPTNNPVLQLTPDGPSYRVAVKPYVFNGINPPLALSTVYAELELHNSSPIVSEAEILDESKSVVWEAWWEAVETSQGLEAELVINVNESVQLDQTLTATVVFSEPVNTSSIDITAGKPPYYNDLTVTTTSWSCTNNPEPHYDTWHGTIEVPAEGISGAIKLCIDGEDNDGNCLKDPAGVFMDEVDAYSDAYHGFGIAFSSEEGWPVFLSHWVNGSPALGDLDGDGDLDVAVQSNKGVVQLSDETGLIVQTLESGDWCDFQYQLYSSPAVADIDLDGDMDVLAVHPYGCNAWDAATGSSLLGWPASLGYAIGATGIYPSRSAPAVCNLVGDAHPEVVICRHMDITQPYAVCSVWMFDYLGNKIWQRELESGGVSVASTPAVGDISSIHSGNEILVCTSDGFVSNFPPPDGGKDFNSAVYLLDPADGENIWKSSTFGCYFFGSPVVGDIDGDGINEIIIGTHIDQTAHRVLVLDGDHGTLEHTFYVSGTVVNSAAICDLNGDGILDIVAVDNTGHVYCWSGEDFSDGNQYDPLPGFPIVVTGNPTSPSIADIDGDFKLEIVVGTGSGYLYAINDDGSICSGYPVTEPGLVEINGQPVIANLDNDDSLELMFADGHDSYAYCYDLGVNSFPALMPWRQFQHDSWHTGCFEADNTIPEPPTNLSGEITYTPGACEVDLEWDLSVNDPYSGSPQEPTDVIWYGIMRAFPWGPFQIISRVHAGTGSYVDCFSAGGPVVVYTVFASDGTNESEYSNYIKFPTSPSDVISVGCSVVEEFTAARVSARTLQTSEPQITEESSHAERTSVHERTAETVPTTILHSAVPSAGNPGCLTDGNTEVCYSPSPGADAIVIDLGEECTVTSVMPERMSEIYPDVISLTDESVRTLETAPAVEPSLIIEVAGSDREFYQIASESQNSIDAVRYVRIRGASGLPEVSVYGSRCTDNGATSIEITRSVEDEGWMFAIPVTEYSEEASVKIYDLSGRMIWSGYAESGSILHWDGYTADRTPVPNGVYLLQCSIGSDVSTGSFVVRRD